MNSILEATRRCFLYAAISIGIASVLQAQIPSGTSYVVLTNTGLGGGDLIAVDATGVASTIRPIPGRVPSTVEELPGQNALLVWNGSGVVAYDRRTGAAVATSLSGGISGSISWGYLDEHRGMVWGESFGSGFRSDDLSGSNPRQFLFNNRNTHSRGAWNGTTGGSVVAHFGISPSLDRIFFVDRQGTVVRSLAHSGFTSLDWSPWSGDLFLAQADATGSRVLRLSQVGALTTIPISGLSRRALLALEVVEQPIEHFVAVHAGGGANVLAFITPRGTVTSLGTLPAASFRDVAVLHGRSLWGAGKWVVGQAGLLTVDFGRNHAGEAYQVALALGHRPGIPLGTAGTLHLTADPLFALSVTGVPGLFVDFSGTLDLQGRAPKTPAVNVPGVPALRGLRVFGAAVAYTSRGVRAVSNAWGTILE
jgi:hypothetical protein